MATEKTYILAIDKKMFKKQRQDLDNIMATKEQAIDEGLMTKAQANSLEGLRNMLDVISDQLAESKKEERFPNGATSWIETHHEVVKAIGIQEQMNEGLAYHVACQRGTGGLYELSEDLTNKFERMHKGKAWDGEFFETIEEFLNQELKEKQ